MAHRIAVTVNIKSRTTQAKNAISERRAATSCNDLQFPKTTAFPAIPDAVMATAGMIQRLVDLRRSRR